MCCKEKYKEFCFATNLVLAEKCATSFTPNKKSKQWKLEVRNDSSEIFACIYARLNPFRTIIVFAPHCY